MKTKTYMEGVSKEVLQCSICNGDVEHQTMPDSNEVFWTLGNNAWPINEGRCCQWCDNNVVIPVRLKMMTDSRRKEEQMLEEMD